MNQLTMKNKDILASSKLLLLLSSLVGSGICSIQSYRFKWKSYGRCGQPFLVSDTTSRVRCAAACSSDAKCLAFTLRSRTVPTAACELTQQLDQDSDSVGNCFVRDSLIENLATSSSTNGETTQSSSSSTTDTSTTTTTTTTTTSVSESPTTTTTTTTTATDSSTTTATETAATTTIATTEAVEVIRTVALDGATGIRAVGFVSDSFTFLEVLLSTSLGPAVTSTNYIVKSEVLKDADAGEESCPRSNQVFVGYGDVNTNDGEKDDQRLYCSALLTPYGLTSNCSNVRLGEGEHPAFENVDTSKWKNWLVCPEGAMMIGINWDYLTAQTLTNYSYKLATCCMAEDRTSA
ncbi:uncharacterized protein LOC135209224 [Macrobrachium nipponense]|uniref:uncharacterized protein LOC135209224 n=1 Tax=Macrobrachium nipponense TaxID=159736 RepID=UPI0030C7F1C9